MAHKSPNAFNEQISMEAAAWLLDLTTGSLDTEGRRAFSDWLRVSPEHVRAFMESAAIWSRAAQIDPAGKYDIEALLSNTGAAAKVVRLTPASESPPRVATVRRHAVPTGRRAIGGRHLLAVAAAVLAAFALWGWFASAQPKIYATDVGQERTIRLEDGSVITLDARSTLSVRFTPAVRGVSLLRGQAFFRVAKNPARPFVVWSRGTAVEDIGTEFDIDQKPEGSDVTVVEGRVAVQPRAFAPPEQEATADGHGIGIFRARGVTASRPLDLREATTYVSGGERLRIVDGSASASRPEPVDALAATAWQHGIIVLHGATLNEVVETFGRYSHRRLIAEDHGPGSFRLSGVFRTDPDFLIRYLRQRPGIAIRETADQIEIAYNAP